MAQQLEFFDIPSPCRGICQADDRGFCRGCLRSREERFGWMSMSDAQKRECCAFAVNASCACNAPIKRPTSRCRNSRRCFNLS